MSSLTLKYANFTDAGQYLCSARNAIGVDSQPAYLEVRCKSSTCHRAASEMASYSL